MAAQQQSTSENIAMVRQQGFISACHGKEAAPCETVFVQSANTLG